MAVKQKTTIPKTRPKELELLKDALSKALIGDFSTDLKIPRVENELTDIFVGVHYMLQVVREKIAELEESEDALQVAQTLAKMASYEYTPHNREIIWSEAVYRILGLDPESEIKSLDYSYKNVHPDHKKIMSNNIDKVLSKGKPFEFEHMIVNRAGETRWVLSKAKAILSSNGKVTKVIGFSQDITEQKEIEQAKSEFLSIASHQLRTPLATIKWYSSLLLKQKESKLKEKPYKYTEYIYQASTRMAALISALLNVSRIELDQINIELEDVNLKLICKSVIEEFSSEVSTKSLHVKESYPRSLAVVRSDSKLIRIVVQNLVSNAVHYTPARGRVNISIEKKNEGLLLTVTDNGYGIPSKDQSKIFTKLFRAGNIRNKVQEGTGIGLYITKSIVEGVCNGRVWFESIVNEGSTFYALIPYTAKKKVSLIKQLSK